MIVGVVKFMMQIRVAKFRRYLKFVAFAFLFSYVPVGRAYEMVSIFELLGNKNYYSSKQVITTGYLDIKDGRLLLYPYMLDSENSDFTREISIILSETFYQKMLESECLQNYVLVFGVFEHRKGAPKAITVSSERDGVLPLERKKDSPVRSSCS